jgi:hypothetical protein
MNHHEIAGCYRLILKQEQTDVAFDTLSGTPRQLAVDGNNLHGDS